MVQYSCSEQQAVDCSKGTFDIILDIIIILSKDGWPLRPIHSRKLC